MPIEIKELVITAHVGATEPPHNKNMPEQQNSPPKSQAQTEANEDIIAQCVEQVLEIIRKKTER